MNWTQLIRYRFQYLDSCENACESSGPMTDGQLLDQMRSVSHAPCSCLHLIKQTSGTLHRGTLHLFD